VAAFFEIMSHLQELQVAPSLTQSTSSLFFIHCYIPKYFLLIYRLRIYTASFPMLHGWEEVHTVMIAARPWWKISIITCCPPSCCVQL